jgi:hypothetical protein
MLSRPFGEKLEARLNPFRLLKTGGRQGDPCPIPNQQPDGSVCTHGKTDAQMQFHRGVGARWAR